jgi:hypothetical protein
LTLPPLELPERAILLHESFAVHSRERRGNSRFYVRDDGAFFHQRNTSDAPADELWDEPFAERPVLLMGPDGLAKLEQFIRDADFASLESSYDNPLVRSSNPVVERFTAASGRAPATVTVHDGALPAQLKHLREGLDALLEEAEPA